MRGTIIASALLLLGITLATLASTKAACQDESVSFSHGTPDLFQGNLTRKQGAGRRDSCRPNCQDDFAPGHVASVNHSLFSPLKAKNLTSMMPSIMLASVVPSVSLRHPYSETKITTYERETHLRRYCGTAILRFCICRQAVP